VTDAIAALAPAPGMTAAICASLGVSRATVQRKRARMSAHGLRRLLLKVDILRAIFAARAA